MNSTNYERAQTLVQALPYIQKFYGKTIVVKYGGNAMINNDLFAAVMEDIVLLNLVGVKVVLVHGGGPEISEILDRMGIESRFINGLRYTTKDHACGADGAVRQGEQKSGGLDLPYRRPCRRPFGVGFGIDSG